MERLTGVTKNHDWGSTTLIPHFLGEDEDGLPWAEQWFGAHPLGPAQLDDAAGTGAGSTPADLRALIQSDPALYLGPSTRFMLGDELPYLVKLIAPARALSLQVHPGRTQAIRGFEREEASGTPIGSPQRLYQDTTHKPEMLYGLTKFEALVGFAVRREARQRLEGLDCPLASRLSRRLLMAAGRGVKPVISWLMDPEEGPSPQEVAQFAAACKQRLEAGASPDAGLDATIVSLQEQFPGQAGIIICFLMNHLEVDPGEAVFVPTGTVHSYQKGLGLEVMANSDNVIRAGLTSKTVSPQLFLETASFDALPPTRIAPEHPVPGINLFRSPVEDFELSVATPNAPGAASPLPLRGTGPRVLVGLEGQVHAQTAASRLTLGRGEAAFVPDSAGPVLVSGDGQIAQVSVP